MFIVQLFNPVKKSLNNVLLELFHFAPYLKCLICTLRKNFPLASILTSSLTKAGHDKTLIPTA
jgi:hypothetical protein